MRARPKLGRLCLGLSLLATWATVARSFGRGGLPYPHGISALGDLSALSTGTAGLVLGGLFVGASAAFVWGWRPLRAAVVAAAPALGLDRVELLTADGAPLRAWATEGALRTEVHLQSLFVRDLALHGLAGAAQRVRFGGHAEAQLLEPVGELVCLVVTDGLVDLLRRAPRSEAGEAGEAGATGDGPA